MFVLPLADLVPEFDRKFGDVSANVGEDVKVAVQFSGKPKRVQWFHNGIEVDEGSKYQVTGSHIVSPWIAYQLVMNRVVFS